jgi:hypothetical protein
VQVKKGKRGKRIKCREYKEKKQGYQVIWKKVKIGWTGQWSQKERRGKGKDERKSL